MYILVKENSKNTRYATYKKPDPSKPINKQGGAIKTDDIKKAFRFLTKEEAEKAQKRAPSLLKNFVVKEIADDKDEADKENKDETDEEVKKKAKKSTKSKRVVFSEDVRKAVYRKTEGHCYLCGEFLDFDNFEVEHALPLSKGGSNKLENLFCVCHMCNDIKRHYEYNEFAAQVCKIANNINKKRGDRNV